MNEACETLANTGGNQLLLISGAFLLFIIGLCIIRRRGVNIGILPVIVAMCLSFYALAPAVTYAQSADECATETPAEDEPAVALQLVNDAGVMQLPDVGTPSVTYYMSLLSNDSAPSGDAFDQDTIDLDPDTAGIQTTLEIYHPDDADYDCGEMNINDFGILTVSLSYECYNESFDLLNLSNDFTIPSFDYVVTTQDNVTATTPATVTIDVLGDPGYVITTVQDDLACESLQTVDILANDATSIGSLDPDTIDLNPNLPGIQQTYTYTQDIFGDLYEFTATVNGDGDIEVSSGASTAGKQFFYTVQNTNGDISIVTLINGGSCA